MSKTTIVQDVLDVFRAAGFEVRESRFGPTPETIIYGTADNAGALMESVLEHFGKATEGADSCAQREKCEVKNLAHAGVTAEPVAWFEAEPSARGRPAKEVIGSMLYSTRFHTKAAPITSNPVWPLYAAPTIPAQVPAAEVRAALEMARSYIDATSTEPGYGFARPDNPHDFHPDAESCSADEIAAHKAACDAYDKGEYTPERGSEWVGAMHILRAPWGIGAYTMRDKQAVKVLAAIDNALAQQSPADKASEVRAAEVETEEWSYSTDEEQYHEQEPSRRAIIQHALAELEERDDGSSSFWIGRNVRFTGKGDAGSIIDALQEQAYEECGEFAETYLQDVTAAEESELESLVTSWAKRVDRSNFWTVTAVEHWTVEQAREYLAAPSTADSANTGALGGKGVEA